jgi:hypothetical protein
VAGWLLSAKVAREEARLWECARLDSRVIDELRAAQTRGD